jgi:hypothetical protein
VFFDYVDHGVAACAAGQQQSTVDIPENVFHFNISLSKKLSRKRQLLLFK